MTGSPTFLLECLHRAGVHDVVAVEPAEGGLAALAGIATRRDAPPVFVKAFTEPPADDVFVAEAEGLAALRDLGGAATPDVLVADREVLVLSMLRPRPRGEHFWEQLAHTPGSRVLPLPRLGHDVVEQGWHRRTHVVKDRRVPVFPNPPYGKHDNRRSALTQLARGGPHHQRPPLREVALNRGRT